MLTNQVQRTPRIKPNYPEGELVLEDPARPSGKPTLMVDDYSPPHREVSHLYIYVNIDQVVYHADINHGYDCSDGHGFNFEL